MEKSCCHSFFYQNLVGVITVEEVHERMLTLKLLGIYDTTALTVENHEDDSIAA